MHVESSAPLLEVSGLTKRFGSVLANENISFHVAPGEIIGVLGENGAGKSTLMNMISGLIRPDAGTICLQGQSRVFSSPREAAAAGVGMVHQHFKLAGALSVAENLALGDARWGKRRLRLAPMIMQLQAIVKRLGIEIDFQARVDSLTVGQQQRVEILKVLSRQPQVLILDEPTAVLTREERPALFALVAELAAQGTAVILISHKLEDILESCERVVILRQGRVVNTSPVAGKSREDLIRLLIGDDLPKLHREPVQVSTTKNLVQVRDLTLMRSDGSCAAEKINFNLEAGEVLALCGVDGNGQSELMLALAGLLKPVTGHIQYWFQNQTKALDAYEVRTGGVCHIPEDRLRDGVLDQASLVDNFLLTQLSYPLFNQHGLLKTGALREAVQQAIQKYEIRTANADSAIAKLSGGNQQKLVLARELYQEPQVVLAAHPTRGLDVQTIAFVNNQLLGCRARGAGVLLLCADLNEAWQMADRIMVMSAGRLYGPVSVSNTSLQEIGQWMTAR